MRADRLLAMTLLLQTRGRLTAEQLAQSLEVSERTVYRDVEALSQAGIPIYGERGSGGGYALVDSYRTTLTGLTEDEVRALFMLSVPPALEALGISGTLRAALLKLAAALPPDYYADEAFVRQRFYLDSTWWFQDQEPAPALQTIHRAVWQDRRLWLTYRLPFETQIQRLVEPYALVAKTSLWYLVYAREGCVRSLPVADVIDAQMADEGFERPESFDLAGYWQDWCARYEQNRPSYPVIVRAAPHLIAWLPYYFGRRFTDRISQADSPDRDGWITLTLPFETFDAARRFILGFGRAVEVLSPLALRESVIDFARQVAAFYDGRDESGNGD